MKKAISLLLALAMCLSLLPLAAPGSQAYSGTDIPYAVEGGNIYFDKATGTITDCDETATKADIPAEIDGVAVTTIGYRALEYCAYLTSVTIPNSVTTIGGHASLAAVA